MAPTWAVPGLLPMSESFIEEQQLGFWVSRIVDTAVSSIGDIFH